MNCGEKHLFSAGSYYVGDPCYAINDWDGIIESTGCFGYSPSNNWEDGKFSLRGKDCFAHGTMHGDGCYRDKQGRKYWVDAGLLSIIPADICDGTSMDGGNLIYFSEDFYAYYKNGTFHFGHVSINTN